MINRGLPRSLKNAAATPAKAGTVKKAAAQADSVAADATALRADFNALLAKLRAAGVLSS